MFGAVSRLLFRFALILATFSAASDAPAAAAPPPVKGVLRLGNVDYVDLAAFCLRFGLQRVPGPATEDRTIFRHASTTLELELNTRDQLVNGMRVFFGEPPRRHANRTWLARLDAELLLEPIFQPGLNQARIPHLRNIVLDPGHGGRDAGVVNEKLALREKDLTLDTARRLERRLAADGYRVLLTRRDDEYLDLLARAEFAARHAADLFVSLHFNSVESGAEQVTGVEVFTLTPRYQFSTSDPDRVERGEAGKLNPGNRFDHWNTLLGHAVHRSLRTTLDTSDRGMKRARYKVLVLAPCPAVLIESGYLSNQNEARKLATPGFRDAIADAIAAGIQSYAGKLQGARGTAP